MYTDVEQRKILVRSLIKDNPKATWQYIKQKTAIKIERVYIGGMGEAFRDAGVEPPRTFRRRSIEEKRAIIINYIQQHPTVGGQTIAKDVKIPVCGVFKTTKEAFDAAGVLYPRLVDKRLQEEKKNKIIHYIKENPLATQPEIQKKFHTELYKLFKNMHDIYKKAGIKFIGAHDKRTIKRQQKIIEFIKNNPNATQREININCKTRIQSLFEHGIFDAYKQAGIRYPFERLKTYGVGKKEIRDRWKHYEDTIAFKLSQFGSISRLVRIKRGIPDIILERRRKKIIIEVKDYRAKEISITQIEQLYNYLENAHCNVGVLVCPNKPQRDAFRMGDKKIFIVQDNHLNDVHYFMNKYG
ncbi:hypothetical protein J4208_03400 [Candidatus Woesearchaeota archaeon]|nr:hypothetical protein [Candidatus Woesearchaeota archaeon]